MLWSKAMHSSHREREIASFDAGWPLIICQNNKVSHVYQPASENYGISLVIQVTETTAFKWPIEDNLSQDLNLVSAPRKCKETKITFACFACCLTSIFCQPIFDLIFREILDENFNRNLQATAD